MKNYHTESLCVQAGYIPETGESRIPQICQSTTFFYGDTQNMADLFDLKAEGFFYSRLANPTVEALEKMGQIFLCEAFPLIPDKDFRV